MRLWKRGRLWWATYKDADGQTIRESLGVTDKRTAQRLLAERSNRAALQQDGIDVGEDVSIDDALELFRQHMVGLDRTDKHITSTCNFARWICDHRKWKSIKQIKPEGVNDYVDKKMKACAPRTVQSHKAAIKAFTKFLSHVAHKLAADPLAGLGKPTPVRQNDRRFLTVDEWKYLAKVVPTLDVECGMPAKERVLLYAVAIQTGLRAKELRALTRGNLTLDDKVPFIELKAKKTKNRKSAKQKLNTDFRASLSKHANLKAPRAPLFKMPHETNTARMLRADVAAARQHWLDEGGDENSDFLLDVNHRGEYLDFHSLRHTTGAWLAINGTSPKAIQRIMRHSNILLTMDTYGHLMPDEDEVAAVSMGAMLRIA